VSRDARRGGWAVAWSRVYAQEGSIPYRLWTEVLRKAMSQGAWQRQELTRRATFFQPLSTLLPELQEYLPPMSSYTPSPTPEQEQLRLWEAARELLTLISENTPLLIALDDLQWSDGSSCELLAYLARRVQNHPIVIVGTCRDNELAANHPLRSLLTDLQREHAVRMVSLAPLSAEQINTLVSNVPHIPDPLVQRISDRAAGNPFFAEELARTLSVQFSTQDDATAKLPQISKSIDVNGEAVLPDTIAAVLDLRLGRLSPPCRSLLNKASVLGSSFEFQVIDAMEAATPGSNEDLVLELLEEALKSGMLTEEGTGTRITYQFWHPLLSSHLYEKLSAARRASLHRRAAEIFLRTYQGREEEGAATITNHLVLGGAPDQQIAHFAELAGNRDYSLSAYREAERHFRVALEHLGDTKENQERRAYLLEILGECTTIQGNDEEARRFYEQALDIHRKENIDPTSPEYRYIAQLQALLWCGIGVTWFNVGNNIQALKCYEQGEHVLQVASILSGPAWARLRYEQSYVYWRDGNYEKAEQAAQEALELFQEAVEPNNHSKQTPRSTRIRHTLNGDPVDLGRAYQLLGVVALGAGQSNKASSHLNTTLNIYEQYDCHREIAIVCSNLGDLYLRRGDFELAHSVLRRSLILAERVGDTPVVSVIFNNLGILSARTGDLTESVSYYQQGISLAEHVNAQVSLSWLLSYLAITLTDQGRLIEASKALQRSLVLSRTTHITPCIGAALIAMGNLRLVQAIKPDNDLNKTQHNVVEISKNLKRAKKTLSNMLAYEGIEAETRTEGQLLLAEVLLLQGEQNTAYQQAIDTLEEARKYELKWLIARAQRVLGSILLAQKQSEQAEQFFEQATRDFRAYGMRLELARTLYPYGNMFLQSSAHGSQDFNRGLEYLQEARRLFSECKAALDLRLVERDLASYALPLV
jgi:predicted ATPase